MNREMTINITLEEVLHRVHYDDWEFVEFDLVERTYTEVDDA